LFFQSDRLHCEQRLEEEPCLSRSRLVRVGAQKLSPLSRVASYELHTIAYSFSISMRTSRVKERERERSRVRVRERERTFIDNQEVTEGR